MRLMLYHLVNCRQRNEPLQMVPYHCSGRVLEKHPQTTNGTLDNYVTGSLLPSLMVQADHITLLDSASLPKIVEGRTVPITATAKAYYGSLVRKIGDFDRVNLKPHATDDINIPIEHLSQAERGVLKYDVRGTSVPGFDTPNSPLHQVAKDHGKWKGCICAGILAQCCLIACSRQ